MPEESLDRFHATLSPDERGRAARFRQGPLRNRFVAGRGLLRAVLARYLAAEPAALAFDYNALGKPRLGPPWDGGELDFNLSHAKGFALLAISGGRPVGVDLECPHPLHNLPGMVARCFSAEEQRQWQSLPAAERLAGFFRVWTCKEAWLKARGSGLAFPLDQVSVTLLPGEPPRLLSIGGDPREAALWRLECSRPAAGCLAAVAVRGAPPRVGAWRWEMA